MLLNHFLRSSPSALVTFIWLIMVSQVSPVQYPTGHEIERHLPTLGSNTRHYPAWIRKWGTFDPSAQILCLGRLPYGHVSQQLLKPGQAYRTRPDVYGGGFVRYEDVYDNLRELCAKPAYGGSITAWAAGAYCASHVNPPTVVFERLPPEGRKVPVETQRVYLMCQNHCRCVNGNYSELAAQGRPATQITEYESIPYREIFTYPERYIISEPLPPRAKLYSRSSPGTTDSSSIPIYFIPERNGRFLGPGQVIPETPFSTTAWAGPFPFYWSPTCDNIVPDDAHPELNYQKLCLAEWFGGSEAGNLGLGCSNLMDAATLSIEIHHFGLKAEKSVQHPMYQYVRSTQDGRHNYRRDLATQCTNFCSCPQPKGEFPAYASGEDALRLSQRLAVLEAELETLRLNLPLEDRMNLLTRGQGAGSSGDASQGRGISLADFGIKGGSLAEFEAVDQQRIRQNAVCNKAKFDGFDVKDSFAIQRLCRSTRWRGRD